MTNGGTEINRVGIQKSTVNKQRSERKTVNTMNSDGRRNRVSVHDVI